MHFDEVTEETDERNVVDVIFMDFEKALYKVPQKRLVNKMRPIEKTGDFCIATLQATEIHPHRIYKLLLKKLRYRIIFGLTEFFLKNT